MDKVWVLVSKWDESEVLAIHKTEKGAYDHRDNYVMPSDIKVIEWDLED